MTNLHFAEIADRFFTRDERLRYQDLRLDMGT
jgi:hypothetical protein